MSNWLNQLAPQLDQKRAQHAYRNRRSLTSAQGAVVNVGGQQYLNFSSNDYLGLANHPSVVSAFKQAANEYGVGAGASHLVVGHSEPHSQLEKTLAKLTGRDRALLFSSGYMANVGTLNSLLGRGDTVFEDKLNHASLIDGGLACGANFYRYRHLSVEHLATQFDKHAKGRALIVTDSLFSMDGDIAPLKQLADFATARQAVLMVDDAHGFGVLGKHGAGSAESFQLTQQQLPILMGTLGKALGVSGAFIAGSHELIETLIQSARNYIYTTALPPACAAAALASLKILHGDNQLQQHLQTLIQYFQQGLKALNLPVPQTQTPIQPIVVGDNAMAMALSDALFQRNILVVAIRPPTVPLGTARLRISFSAAHTFEQLDQLLNALDMACKATGLAR